MLALEQFMRVGPGRMETPTTARVTPFHRGEQFEAPSIRHGDGFTELPGTLRFIPNFFHDQIASLADSANIHHLSRTGRHSF